MIILDQCHSASEKLWAYPFPNPTLTVACHQLTVVVQGRGRWTVPQIQTLNDNFSQIQNLTIAPLSWHYKEDTLGEKNYCIMQPDLTKKKQNWFCMISYQDKFLSQWQDFNKNYPCHTRPNFFCNLPLPCVSVTFSREFPFVAKTYTCHLLPCLISHHNNSTIYATWSLNIVGCISWEKIPYVNYLTPKICFLILPSSCYTFPCK